MIFNGFNLNSINQSHYLTLSGSSAKIELLDGEKIHLSEREFLNKELSFIQKVRREILKNAQSKYEHDILNFKKSVIYFEIADIKNTDKIVLHNLVEIDINGAYWNAAYQLGLICLDTYNLGKEQSKRSRLAAVGSVATVKTQFYFDGEIGDYELLGCNSDYIGRIAFIKIAAFISDIMLDIFNKKKCILFWVDAIFCFKEDEYFVKWVLDSALMEYKTKQIDNIVYSKKNGNRVCEVTEILENGEKKVKTMRKNYQKKGGKTVSLYENTRKNKKALENWAKNT